MKTYDILKTIPTFIKRYEYLKLSGVVSDMTFNGHRYLNQDFYRSKEWKRSRDLVIIRDNGCDLGISDRVITGKIYIHHIEPITIDDILNVSSKLFDLNNLICVSFNTHNAIHYGDSNLLLDNNIVERKIGDTKLW